MDNGGGGDFPGRSIASQPENVPMFTVLLRFTFRFTSVVILFLYFIDVSPEIFMGFSRRRRIPQSMLAAVSRVDARQWKMSISPCLPSFPERRVAALHLFSPSSTGMAADTAQPISSLLHPPNFPLNLPPISTSPPNLPPECLSMI
jgi:hypothetical protein